MRLILASRVPHYGMRDLVLHCLANKPEDLNCEREVIVTRPSPWRECTGDLQLNLREVEGQEEVLEDKDEEEKENEVDEKVKEVRENAQLMHATW